MATLHYQQQNYLCQKDETVLDTLLNKNVDIAYGCRQGVCQSCMLRSIETPPAEAQVGLKENQKQQNYFLACRCKPESDLHIEPIKQSEFVHEVEVLAKRQLNHDTLLLRLSHSDDFHFKAGQFINLKTPDNIVRSYSISNPPNKNNQIDLHIRVLKNGRFSTWVHQDLKIGDKIPMSAALGDCFYTNDKPEQNLLLVGTGSGLAPLYGILQDALAQQHQGKIHLFHGSRNAEDLYLMDEIKQLVTQYDTLNYSPCLSGYYTDEHVNSYCKGRVHDVALSTYTDLNNWRVYLCGHPEMVKQMQTQVFLKGADMDDIFMDAFHLSSNLIENAS
ncbi:MAG: 2Fe-2S iron-sulfur cluster binding domain-containing protein [Methylococcales bacterium]|nr:2Fe-2S iron-sulfur cluster binding domain-containing protein [Methylococcales bacterium]